MISCVSQWFSISEYSYMPIFISRQNYIGILQYSDIRRRLKCFVHEGFLRVKGIAKMHNDNTQLLQRVDAYLFAIIPIIVNKYA
jgi:hypothetical protein